MADYTARRIEDMETFYRGLFRKARSELGVRSFGLAFVELDPGAENYPEHDHSGGQEEVFIVLRGKGEMTIEGEKVPLDPDTVVRVGPDAKRRIHPGREGMRLVAIGGTPGHPYEPPPYTELGEPDPLDG
jgi:mannose-6-phosphate isomerase-like protein (cupin superfamily)